MKNIAVFSFLIIGLLLPNGLLSQNENKDKSRFGIFGGLHSYDVPVSNFNEFKAGINDAQYGIHAGIKIKLDLGNMYLEPALMFNSISAKYTVDNPETGEVEANSLNFDIPVVMGLDLDLITIFAGPVAHIRFANYDDLKEFGSYDDNLSRVFVGAQGGIGIHFGNLGIELRYEKNFKGPDYGVEELLNQIELVDTNSRLIGSIVVFL
jgi:hypothetical protein